MASFAAEPVFYIGSLQITNTVLNTLLVDAVLISAAIGIKKNIALIPNYFQNGAELLINTFYELTESVAQHKTGKIFPYFMTFFLFILIANWSALLPGIGTIGFFETEGHKKTLIPLLRGATSDINTTFALAIVSVIATHMLSIRILGLKEYVGRFVSLNPINLFIGILEIISEITKVVSLSFRLFGNIFAGEVVLLTVSTIFAFIFPLPFMMLEIVVGFVQALVFSMLTMAFMAILTTSHHEAKEVNHA